jgi:SAM-dependent methyltransferase
VPVDYSRVAADYDAIRGSAHLDRTYWLPALVEAGSLRPAERILDLGAGTGRFSALVAEFARVVAADISLPMLAKAQPKGGFAVVRADAASLPFPSDTFDAALLVMVVHQLPDYKLALREVARVSRRAVIATSDMERRRLGVLEEAFPSLRPIDLRRFPRISDLTATLMSAGFSDVTVDVRPLQRSWPVTEQLDRIRRKYISTFDLLPQGEFERGLEFLEREMPKRFGETYTVTDSFTFVAATREP